MQSFQWLILRVLDDFDCSVGKWTPGFAVVIAVRTEKLAACAIEPIGLGWRNFLVTTDACSKIWPVADVIKEMDKKKDKYLSFVCHIVESVKCPERKAENVCVRFSVFYSQ